MNNDTVVFSKIIYELCPSILIITGIALIILTIIFFRRFGEKIQRIKIDKIGLQAELSTNVFLTLLGLVVLGIGTYLLIQNYEDKISTLQKEKLQLKQQESHFQKFARNIRQAMQKYHYTFYPEFPEGNQNPRDLSYFLNMRKKGGDQHIQTPITPKAAPFGVRILLEDFDEGDEFFITVVDPRTRESWSSKEVTIPEHILQLQKLSP